MEIAKFTMIAAMICIAGGCGTASVNSKSAEIQFSHLHTFGKRTPNSIRVTIYGFSVNRPGHYLLPTGSTVHDAMQAAQFNGRSWWEWPYSGIERKNSDGSVDTIWFTRESYSTDQDRVLRNNDVLRLSHEVY